MLHRITRTRRARILIATAVALTGLGIGALGASPVSLSSVKNAVADAIAPPATGVHRSVRDPETIPLATATTTVMATAEPAVVPAVEPTTVPTAAPTPAPTPPPPQTVFTIAVPVYRQTMVLDCETAALQMALATYGYTYSQDALFALENPDLRAPVMGPNHTVLRWGNPYKQFVGQVNGNDYTPTGFGIYWPPILQIAQSKGLTNARGGEGYAPATVYDALMRGKAVQVWVETNWIRTLVGTWTAWDGQAVRYSYAEHSLILSGVSPTQVRVNDPLHGTQYWVSKATFEISWADFNNMAVIY